MATGIMLDDGEGLQALATVLAKSPAPMLRALSGVVEAMQVVEHDHAETVAKLESETESKRLKIEALEATAAAQTGRIAELDEENWAVRQEAYTLRVMNEALLDERGRSRGGSDRILCARRRWRDRYSGDGHQSRCWHQDGTRSSCVSG